MGYMLVQTCVRASPLRGLEASPCRQLQGNQDRTTSITTKSCSAVKNIVHMPSGKTELQANFGFAYSGLPTNTPPAIGYYPLVGGVRTDYANFNQLISDIFATACTSKEVVMSFGSEGSVYNQNWTQQSQVTGLNNYITRSIVSDPNNYFGGAVSNGWYDRLSTFQDFGFFATYADKAPQNDPTTNPTYNAVNLVDAAVSNFYVIATDGSSNSSKNGLDFLTVTNGGAVPFEDNYTFLNDRFLAQAFTWAGGGFSLLFKEWPVVGTPATGTAGGNLIEASGFFDLSNMVTPGDSVGALQVGQCTNGWRVATSALSSVVVMRQIVKFNAVAAIVRPYFIGRYRSNLNQNPGFAAGSVTESIIDIISSGQIFGGQTIGMAADGADINLPFPSSVPFPINGLGADSATLEDYYFAVIGTDPSAWAAANGFTLGTKMG